MEIDVSCMLVCIAVLDDFLRNQYCLAINYITGLTPTTTSTLIPRNLPHTASSMYIRSTPKHILSYWLSLIISELEAKFPVYYLYLRGMKNLVHMIHINGN